MPADGGAISFAVGGRSSVTATRGASARGSGIQDPGARGLMAGQGLSRIDDTVLAVDYLSQLLIPHQPGITAIADGHLALVSKIDGAVPTMVVEKEGSKTLEAAAKADTLLGVEHSAFGTYGDPAAPRLWMIFDPYCSYSVRAFDELKPYVAAGRIQLAIDQNQTAPRPTHDARALARAIPSGDPACPAGISI